MSKVKLLGNLQTGNGVIAEGKVVDLPDAQAEKLISLGAAEASDDATTATVDETPKAQEVETPADPLVPTPPATDSTPLEQPAAPAEANQPVPSEPEATTSETPASSSINLHLS